MAKNEIKILGVLGLIYIAIIMFTFQILSPI